jgi:hypothetical protein
MRTFLRRGLKNLSKGKKREKRKEKKTKKRAGMRPQEFHLSEAQKRKLLERAARAGRPPPVFPGAQELEHLSHVQLIKKFRTFDLPAPRSEQERRQAQEAVAAARAPPAASAAAEQPPAASAAAEQPLLRSLSQLRRSRSRSPRRRRSRSRSPRRSPSPIRRRSRSPSPTISKPTEPYNPGKRTKAD